MMPRIESKKKNVRKEIKLLNLLNIPAAAIFHKPTNRESIKLLPLLLLLMHSTFLLLLLIYGKNKGSKNFLSNLFFESFISKFYNLYYENWANNLMDKLKLQMFDLIFNLRNSI